MGALGLAPRLTLLLTPENRLIGVDGGGSGFRAYGVERAAQGFICEPGRSAEGSWDYPDAFSPTPIDRQMDEAKNSPGGEALPLGNMELEAAEQQVRVLGKAIEFLCGDQGEAFRLGLCMPGLRTASGRGIAICRHGPRSPQLLDKLEKECARRGLNLAVSPPALESDGRAAAWGEEVASGGQLAGVPNAYYIGAGTGLAEGLKVADVHLDLTRLRQHLPAAWAGRGPSGKSWEDEASFGGMQLLWERSGDGWVDQAAQAGDVRAREILHSGACALGRWLLMRMEALEAWEGKVLQRIVVGQRSGQLLADSMAAAWYGDPLREILQAGLLARQDTSMVVHALTAGSLRPGFLCASVLRAAPALGMAARALDGSASA
jgi:hypothetical protein